MPENPLELTINKVIKEIEGGLLRGEITNRTPQLAFDYRSMLGAYLSMCYGMIEKLDTLQAQHHVDAKMAVDESGKPKMTDLSISKAWKVTHEGVRQLFWENRIKRLKILCDTIEIIYYQGRSEEKVINKEPRL